jgi:hypothetical protein
MNDCSNCQAGRDCTAGIYTGACPASRSVELVSGKWWANYGVDGPFKSEAAARDYEQTH